MKEETMNTLQSMFETLEDPRVDRTKRHQLLDIIILAILGVLCGAEGWVEIESFGKTKEAWLRTFLALPNGIPSHDTFGRVFARVDPKQFEACFLNWVRSLNEKIAGVIALDGVSISNPAFCTLSKIWWLAVVLVCLPRRIEENGCDIGNGDSLIGSSLMSVVARMLVWPSRPIRLLNVHFSRLDMLTPNE